MEGGKGERLKQKAVAGDLQEVLRIRQPWCCPVAPTPGRQQTERESQEESSREQGEAGLMHTALAKCHPVVIGLQALLDVHQMLKETSP